MATRQYIGARYVPKFFDNPDGSNNWMNGVAYEALTIVEYADNSYTSKIPVPATVGSPNDNPTYWVSTGTGGSGGGGSEINEIKKQIEGINSDIQTINSDIAKIEKEIEIKNDKYIFITDSYGTYLNNNKNYIQLALSYANVPEENATIRAESGAGFKPPAQFKTFNMVLNEVAETIVDKNSITDIYFLGGANDSNDTNRSNLLTAINQTIQNAKILFTNADVHIGCVSRNNNNIQNMALVAECYATADKYNGNYLMNTECIMSELKMFLADNVHPTNDAVIELGWRISECLKVGYTNVIKTINMGISVNPNQTSPKLTIETSNLVMKQINSSVSVEGSLIFNVEGATSGSRRLFLDSSFLPENTLCIGSPSKSFPTFTTVVSNGAALISSCNLTIGNVIRDTRNIPRISADLYSEVGQTITKVNIQVSGTMSLF